MLGKLISNWWRREQLQAPDGALGHRDGARLKAALSLAKAGRAGEAEAIYRELSRSHPQNADLLHLLGNTAKARGSFDEAVELLQRAAALAPDSAVLQCHLADAFAAAGASANAIDHYQRALAAEPSLAPACINLGDVLRKAGRFKEAAEAYRRARDICPEVAEVHIALAAVLREVGDWDAALAAAERALEIAPESPDALVGLGHALRDLGQSDAALAAYRRAVELRPDVPQTYLHLGNALFLDGRGIDEATQAFTRALEIKSDYDEARFNLALTRLARGDYANGWPDYELRRLNADWPLRPVAFSPWTGGNPDGRKVLVYREQGLGDEIMFASCIPDLIGAGADAIIECSPKLEALYRHSFPQATVYAANAERTLPAAIEARRIDFETPVGSMPLYFRRARAAFPRHAGYLRADPQSIAAWRSRLSALGPGLKVGISWQGGTQKSRRLARSLPLARLLPILQTGNAHFVDLQYTDCRDESAALYARTGVRVHSWDIVRGDYAETAALVSALDLVISVCTAVIHLGGALGRPVWVMVPYGCEWRYGIAGEEMPWYPSVRLLRQTSFGEWDAVIGKVARGLHELVQAKAPV